MTGDRIVYSVGPSGEVIKRCGKKPAGDSRLDFAMLPFEEQMRKAYYHLECTQQYRESPDLSTREIKKAWWE